MTIYRRVVSFQVLQRDFRSNSATVHCANGTLLTLPSGGPYTVDDAHHVYVGDIWIMAGQSNMRGFGFMHDLVTQQPLVHDPIPGVHLFQSNETWSTAADPTHRLSESPRSVHHRLPDPTVRDPSLVDIRGASLGLPFAEQYRQANHQTPVGLVASAHGGTSMDQWLESGQDSLYGAMLARIEKVGGAIAGILWFQGETEGMAGGNGIYDYADKTRQLFDRMRTDITPEIPIACIQLGRLISTSVPDNNWSQIRFHQQHLFDTYPRCQAVTAIDTDNDDFVHLGARGLAKVGRRLAIAATHVLRDDNLPSSPRMEQAVVHRIHIKNGVSMQFIKVSFQHADTIRWRSLSEVHGFSVRDIQDNNKEYSVIVKAVINEQDKSIHLFLNRDAGAVLSNNKDRLCLCYGWGKTPICNLTTTTDMAPLATKIPLFTP
ncbi:hypothetical protein K492DRAFT_205311 [Lichtheimia hyalospora FSU 10163]|nr:hypothetical protein K492DRAFT_205311 [Lichtheimia hyalospora FSU 10163]